ncbi:HMA2 domain-containing protein [Pontibacillus sp. HMF3514]|uniref:HMA2 domain-containing protein n=1 Tax=Pontibacillus sp. HMF3514 TaxID=2692425 RepID=UPI001320404B|nr:hypothetical protein [Pontibacillus sp. HMF3514]QHE51553.1 hypothetical protein GS400_05670 [Pontibacillus sp. HMF3514]
MISSLLGISTSIIAPKLLSNLKDQKIHILHVMPGRIRLQCDQWKNKLVAQSLESSYKQIPVIKDVKCSPYTGSLLLEFNVQHLDPDHFHQLLQHAVNVSQELYPSMESELMKKMRGTVNSFDGLIKKRTSGKVDVDSLLLLIMLGKGVTGFNRNPAFSSSLLFWAYTLIKNEVEIKDDN